MILINNFYTVKNKNISDEKAEFRINLNAENFVYKAHFPNNPITPGVCLIQMAVELFGVVKSKKFSIKTLKNVKFTSPINPLEFPEVDFVLEFTEKAGLWQLKVLIKENETIFAKMIMMLSTNSLI